MTARIIDGRAAAQKMRAACRHKIDALKAKGVTPGLAVVLVGENPVSDVYVRNKARACAEVGLHSEVRRLPVDCSEVALLGCLDELNRDPRVHGIIVQLPLPRHLDAPRVLQALAAEKDVDGFNWSNLGALVEDRPRFVPCTPLAVMRLLEHEDIAVEGRTAVVVGRSSIVGKPLALLLIAHSATVTVCHSRTLDLARVTREADILVVAAGRPALVTGEMIKPGATVIDVGINRLPDGSIVGDVDFAGARERAAYITPVPGGVGPMTVAMLVANTVTAAERWAARATGC
jgi:methylenetetrahydrofolate dehydrogenase (NADP+) / methenyltetrahydrofolate cyclohydrolase